MGTLGLSGNRLASFNPSLHTHGLNLGIRKAEIVPGYFKCKATETIRQGQLVALNSDGLLISATGSNVIGVANANKMTLGRAVKADEPIVLNDEDVTNLSRANLTSGQLSVFSAVEQGGTKYTITTDYLINETNGTIARVAAGSITDGQTVFVTYSYDMTAADHAREGTNFFNTQDDVTLQENRMSVIMGPAMIFTTEYSKSATYSLTGATSSLFCKADGLFTSVDANEYVGRVIQLPSADCPYLGVLLTSHPEEI